MLIGTVTMGGITLFVTQYLQLVDGLAPLTAGLWLVPPALGVTAGSILAPPLARRIRPAFAMSLSLAVSAVGFVALTQVRAGSGVGLLVAGYTLAFFGVGPVGVLGTEMVVGSAPADRAGSASALSETAGQLSIATLGSIGTAIFRERTGGTDIADGAGTTLSPAAQAAFAAGLNAVAGICAVAVLGFAIMAALALPNTRSASNAAATA